MKKNKLGLVSGVIGGLFGASQMMPTNTTAGTDATQVNKLADQGGTQSPATENGTLKEQTSLPITNRKLGNPTDHIFYNNSMGPKEYGQYLQANNLQKWNKKRK